MKPSTCVRGVAICSAVVAALSGTGAHGAIVEYKFNTTGTTSPSTGTDPAVLEFRNSSGTVDLHGAPGSGVTGGLGLPSSALDRAFDNTAASGMGNAGTGGGGGFHLADNDNIDALLSFTLSGWFQTDGTAPINGFARLFLNRSGTEGYHLLGGDVGGELRPAVDATELSGPDVVGYADTEKWVFFAMTYDGTASTDNAKFYKGYRNASEAPGGAFAVKLLETRTIAQDASANDTVVLSIGDQAAFNRPFDGYLDNMRIDGSKVDTTGVLSLAALESRRASDVPEPAAIALGGVLTAGLLSRRSRMARR